MVVATPCTAPSWEPPSVSPWRKARAAAFAVFTALALGLAAPYVLLTFYPAWMRHLPRPGAWMEVLKQATAVPIFATVIWLVWLFASSAGVDALTALLAALLLLAIAGWILGRWPARRVASVFAVSVIVLAVATPLYALWKFPAAETNSARLGSGASQAGWEPYSRAAIEQYRAQGRPVFVDFTARWCLSCQVNERAVLNRGDVRRRLRDSGIVLVRADWTKHDESIASALTELGRSGVPTYVFYRPGQPALVLPEVLTPGVVFGALDQLQNRSQAQHPGASGTLTVSSNPKRISPMNRKSHVHAHWPRLWPPSSPLSPPPRRAPPRSAPQAPDFHGTDSNGKTQSLDQYKGKYVVLEWHNHDCPYTIKHYKSGNMQSLQKEWTAKGVVWFTVISSAPGHPGLRRCRPGKCLHEEDGRAADSGHPRSQRRDRASLRGQDHSQHVHHRSQWETDLRRRHRRSSHHRKSQTFSRRRTTSPRHCPRP